MLHSRYNPVNLILVLFVNIIMVWITSVLFVAIIKKHLQAGVFNESGVILFILLFLVIITGFMLRFLMVDARYIKANREYILFINPVFPFLKKKVYWSDFDYFYYVKEKSQYKEYKTIWLIKDGKVKGRISEFYYANYSLLKALAVQRVPGNGALRMNSLSQLLYILGHKLPEKQQNIR